MTFLRWAMIALFAIGSTMFIASGWRQHRRGELPLDLVLAGVFLLTIWMIWP